MNGGVMVLESVCVGGEGCGGAGVGERQEGVVSCLRAAVVVLGEECERPRVVKRKGWKKKVIAVASAFCGYRGVAYGRG